MRAGAEADQQRVDRGERAGEPDAEAPQRVVVDDHAHQHQPQPLAVVELAQRHLEPGDPGVGLLDVLDAHVDALVKDTTLEHLVDEDTHGGLSDVPHTAGTAVVVPVGHTLVDGAVDLDVHEVTQLVGGQVSLHGGKAMVAKPLGEHVARVATHATSPTAPHLCRSHTHAHATLSLLIS